MRASYEGFSQMAADAIQNFLLREGVHLGFPQYQQDSGFPQCH